MSYTIFSMILTYESGVGTNINVLSNFLFKILTSKSDVGTVMS